MRDNVNPRIFRTSTLFGPHSVIILFDNVGNSANPMTYNVDIVRHIEGKPSDLADMLEIKAAPLVSADSPLDLLRKHTFDDDFDYNMLSGICHKYGCNDQ
jgi:hypothetical protein